MAMRKAIKNFIYLDDQKLRSLSSQVFEGVTEKIVESRDHGTSESEEQRGPVGSGRVLADIIRKTASSTDHKFLDDYAYSLFESFIEENGMVEHSVAVADKSAPFIKIEGRMLFGDNKKTREILNKFNELGYYFEILEQFDFNSDPSRKLSNNEKKSISNAAAQRGLQGNPDYIEALSKLFEFGFADLLEVKIASDGRLYSAPIKRLGLREDEVEIIQKYSRISEGNFTLVGTVTQRAAIEAPREFGPAGAETLRDQTLFLANALREIEDSFFGRAGNEVIVDPIAIYSNL